MPTIDNTEMWRELLIRDLEQAKRASWDATDTLEAGIDGTDYKALTEKIPGFVRDNSVHVNRVVDWMIRDWGFF